MLISACDATAGGIFTVPVGKWQQATLSDDGCQIRFQPSYISDGTAGPEIHFDYYINGGSIQSVTVLEGHTFEACGKFITPRAIVNGDNVQVELTLVETGETLPVTVKEPPKTEEGKIFGTVTPIPEVESIDFQLPSEQGLEDVYSKEKVIFEAYGSQLSLGEFKKNEFKTIMDRGIKFGIGKVNVVAGKIQTEVVEAGDVLIPVFSVNPAVTKELLNSYLQYLQTGSGYLTQEYLAHWMNHLNPADFEASASFFTQIVKSATVVVRFQDKVMFIAEINGNKWAAILQQFGAPITAFNASLKNGKFNPGSAQNYLTSKLAQGWQLANRNELPAEIQKYWGDGSRPPVWRFWWWSASYGAEVIARTLRISAVAALTPWIAFVGNSTTDFMFVVFPSCTETTMDWCVINSQGTFQ